MIWLKVFIVVYDVIEIKKNFARLQKMALLSSVVIELLREAIRSRVYNCNDFAPKCSFKSLVASGIYQQFAIQKVVILVCWRKSTKKWGIPGMSSSK